MKHHNNHNVSQMSSPTSGLYDNPTETQNQSAGINWNIVTRQIRNGSRHIPLIGLCVVNLFPIYFMILTSFKSRGDYWVNKLGPPAPWTLENYHTVFKGGRFFTWIGNSLILTVVSVVLTMVIPSLAAYAFSLMRFRGKEILFNVFIALMIVPPVVMLIPLFISFSKVGLVNSYLGPIIIYTGLLLPFSTYLLSKFFQSVPREIIDAAVVDGCSNFGILVRILIPLSKSALITLLVVNALYVWNELLIAVVFLQDDKMRTLIAGLTVFKGRYTINIPAIMAGACLAAAPIIILYLWGQRYFIRGLIAGAVKE
jgi:ABC-type glycerol-3-phosphate transport system permease component